MDKGTRVQITEGDGEGITGTVFWTGKDRYRDGLRLGVRGDDGETYWVSEVDVRVSDAPVPTGDTFEKGDRVQFSTRGQSGTGTVFWTGQSRNGPGQRLGIRDDNNEDEAVWIDARFVSLLDDQSAPPQQAPRAQRSSGTNSSYDADYAAPVSANEMPAPPPMDDSWIDQMAGEMDAAEEPGFDYPGEY